MSNPYAQSYNRYAGAFGINPTVLAEIGRLESGHRPGAVNDWDSNAAKGTPSKGIMQFIKPTFDAFYRQASAARPDVFRGLGPKDWMNPEQQIATTAWALKNNKGSHWATYDRALSKAGGKLEGRRYWDGSETPQNASQARLEVTPGSGPDPDKVEAFQKLAAWDNPRYGGELAQYLKDNPYRQQQISVHHPNDGHDHSDWSPAGNNTMQRMKSFINRWGIKFDSNNPWHANPQQGGGKHTAGSYHYANSAFDVGDAKNRALLYGQQLQNYVRQNPSIFKEAFFNPWGFGVKNGKVVEGLRIGGHDDHGHFAFY